MKRTLLIIACMLTSITMQAQEDPNDYLPFVELGKQWHVVSNVTNPYVPCSLERYQMFEEVERDGKIYAHTRRVDDEQGTYQDTGLFREEDRRVYKYDEEKGRDIMMYDFSLKEGDTFTYEFGFNKPVNCKVLKQGWLENGPQIVSSRTINTDGTQETTYRQLRTWTIVVDDDSGEYSDSWDVTWIECIGALRNMFISQYLVGLMSCLAYIERDGSKTDNLGNDYLPFSLNNMYGPVYGCDLPTGSTINTETEDRRHHLTYELENHRLHVFGDVLTQCGPNNYAYFYEKPTEDPWVHKIEFEIQEVEPTMDCVALHATDFYVPVPGFDPSRNYIIVDNQGEEHPVIKKTTQVDYRPLLEEGKVWKYSYNNGVREYMKSLTISGDTIIRNQTYKKIIDVASQAVEMALREEDKKVYCCYPNRDTEILLYDFGKNVGDLISKEVKDGDTWIQRVISVDIVMVEDNAFRCMTVHEYCIPQGMSEEEYLIRNYGYSTGFWIEGIGSFSYLDSPIPQPGNYYTFYECSIGDMTINQKDFLDLIIHDNLPEYRPFVEDDKVWKVGDVTSGNPVQLVDYYFFDDDTIINGKTCKQMMRKRYVSPEHPNFDFLSQEPSLIYVGAWYEEDKKVYLYDTTLNQFTMMYDFSLEEGGIFQKDGQTYVIGPKQTGVKTGFKGVSRNVMEKRDGEQRFYNTTWLEGVGGLDCPTTSVCPDYVGSGWYLMECYVGDEVIYLNDECEDGATPELSGARKHRFDFTHTTKIQPKTRTRSEAEPSLYGEYSEHQLNIHLDPINDAYQVSITDASGKVAYQKTIDAGNIVGLNIDISSYPKGYYNVTVENDNESFTGTFEAQTTGIMDVRKKAEEAGDRIYNLQGQRLNSLQKGLNIVNGQKVYVK